MKANLFTAILLCCSLFAQSQDFKAKFTELSARNDTAAQRNLLKEWETTSPRDPEMFIGYSNYFIQKGSHEVLAIDNNVKPGEKAFEISDPVTGEPVAFMHGSVRYELPVIRKGISYLDRGIAIYPNRLDMRFGKIYLLGETGNYEEFTKEIVETIHHGNQIGYAWLWCEGKPLEDAKAGFLNAIQGYIKTIYETQDDNLLPYMRQISETVLKYFPNDVPHLSNIALTYLVNGENDKALPFLLKAEAADPQDVIVLNNLAATYLRKNDKPRAKAYFEKVITHGTAEEAQHAREKLKRL